MQPPKNNEEVKYDKIIDNREIDRLLIQQICGERKFPYQIQIHYTKDLSNEVLKYLQREKTINYFKNEDLSELNAVALPFEGLGFHIVIDEDKEHPFTTAIHEATHIIDYYEFMVNFNNNSYDIENNKLYRAFYCYTEFNARFLAHSFYLKNINLQLPKDIELPDLINLIDQFNNKYAYIATVPDFYKLMQWLGCWAAIEYVNSTTYNLPNYNGLYDKLWVVKQETNYKTLTELDAEFDKCSLFWYK